MVKRRSLSEAWTPQARGKFRWECRSLVTRGPEAGGSVRQFSGALPSACAPLPLLLLGISGHEATSSQRKLEVQSSSRFLLVSQTQFPLPLLLHMSNLPFRPADVFPPSQMQTCLPAIRGEKFDERNSNLWRKKLWERESEGDSKIPVEKTSLLSSFNAVQF